jgi:O-antigen/teichoic acid export membrane protein
LGWLSRFVAPEDRPVSAKVVRNALFNGLRVVLTWPVPLLLIPFILGKVGVVGYGTWAVLLALISLTSLADVGLAGTLTKHVAEHYARRDVAALNRLISTGLMLYSLIAFAVVVVLEAAGRLLIPVLLRGSAVPQPELRVLWHYTLAIVATNLITLAFYSVVTGLQRMELSSILGSFNVLSGALLTVVFLEWRWALRGLLIANLVATALTLLLYVWMVYRLLPGFRLNPFRFEWADVKSIFSFSLQIYVTGIAVVIYNHIEKLYLAWFVGVVPAGWYNIASEAAWKIRNIPGLLLTPVMAGASELHARGEWEKLRELYYRSHKYVAFVSVPMAVYVATVSRRLVDLWVGPKLGIVAMPLAVLVAVNFFNLTTGPGYYVLIGQGILRPGVYSALLGIGLNLPLSLVLIYFYGFSGAVVGTAASVIVASTFFIYLFHKKTKNPFGRLIRGAYLKPAVWSLVAVAVLLLVRPSPRPGWAGLAVEGLGFGSVYFLGLVLSRFFDDFDLAKVESLLPFTRFVRRIIPIA